MNSDNPISNPPENFQRKKITKKNIEIAFGVDYFGGSNSYHKEETSVLTIIDKNGSNIEPIWKIDWTEIVPGIKTRKGDNVGRSGHIEIAEKGFIQIERFACPVYIQFRSHHQYTDYDNSEYDTSSGYDYWILYESE